MTKKNEKNEKSSISYGEEDIVIEQDDQTASDIIKKLRKRLRSCEKEKKEYLDGWQRAKADLLNFKKESVEKLRRAEYSSQETLVTELLPVIDSFDMAFKGSAWESVDDVWKKGVEYIYTQLIDILESKGFERFGKKGDSFDPNLYEAVEEREPEEGESRQKSGTVIDVIRSGYKSKNGVIRPARVVVAK